MMSTYAKWEYMKTIYERYHLAKTKKEKTLILNEFTKTYNCHRKHAIRLLNAPPPPDKKPKRSPRGSVYDNPRLLDILRGVWQSSGYPCGQRLKATIKIWLKGIRNRFNITVEEEKLLLTMSPSTIDRKLKMYKANLRKNIYYTTRGGLFLKSQIPIKVSNWDIKKPGFSEIDLVAHCGNSAEGIFANTLDMTDICTGWTERRCILGKSQKDVKKAIDDIRRFLPYKLLGIKSDNGSEFINRDLYNYCLKTKLKFNRSRPLKKDDNCYVEQKNYTHVRKYLGYYRYETEEVVSLINELYRNELRLFQNLFQPSLKLISKEIIGSKRRRIYDEAKTPLERLIESGYGDKKKIKELIKIKESIDPFKLAEVIDKKLELIWSKSSKSPKPVFIKIPRRKKYPEISKLDFILKPEILPKIEDYKNILRKELLLERW